MTRSVAPLRPAARLGASAALALGLWLAATPALAGEACPRLEPGKRLGERFSIGTVLKAPDSVEADALPGWHRPKDPAGHAVRLRFDDKRRLVELEAPLPTCVQLGKRRIEAKDPRAFAAALGSCGPAQILEGGNLIDCGGVRVVFGAAGGTAAPTLRIAAGRAPGKGCSHYVDGEGLIGARGREALKDGEVPVPAGAALCVEGLDRPIPAGIDRAAFEALRPGCTVQANRGASLVKCGELTWIFAGPKNVLHALRVD
jgi:hypothetical protein